MPTLLFKGYPHMDQYNGPGVSVKAGEEVEVTAAQAAYLLESFGDAFEAVGSAVAAPKKSRAVKSPNKRGGASKAKGTDK